MAPIRPEELPAANLPAPYRSPWSLLAADLVAVGADLVLRWRELWRRNRQGQLPCPRFWPASMAASFWPLALVLALALLAAGLWVGARPGASPAAVPPELNASGPASPGSPGLEPPGPDPQAPSRAQSPASPQPELGPQAPDPGGPGSESKAPIAPPGPGPSPVAGSPGSPPASGLEIGPPPRGDGARALVSPPVESPPLEPNPLESWLQRPEAAGLLLQVGGDPTTSRIQLVLSDGFGQLQTREQQQQADLWLTWAQDWGYDQLELRGQDGSLLGREARVGGGMILGLSP